MTDPLLTFADVQHAFGAKQVLCGLNLDVKPGEVHALLGENGAGKTTAIDIALGFLNPDAGSARVLGVSSLDLTGELRERIGYVSEGHKLIEWMSVRGVLDFEAGTRKRFDRKLAEERVRAVGLDLKQRVRTLSRGQRARLAVIIAMVGKPDLLILDDPALGLDARMRRELLDEMIQLLADHGCGVLLTTHILQEVERVADRISILSGGRIMFETTLDTLRMAASKRRVQVPAGAAPPAAGVGGVLAVTATRDGFEVLFWNETGPPAIPSEWTVSDPVSVDLEELFLDLTISAPRAEVTA